MGEHRTTALTALFALWADMPGHPWTAAISATIGAYAMAAFHGLRGACWLNTAGRPNPATPASPGTQGG